MQVKITNAHTRLRRRRGRPLADRTLSDQSSGWMNALPARKITFGASCTYDCLTFVLPPVSRLAMETTKLSSKGQGWTSPMHCISPAASAARSVSAPSTQTLLMVLLQYVRTTANVQGESRASASAVPLAASLSHDPDDPFALDNVEAPNARHVRPRGQARLVPGAVA